ncbi:MAG: sigma 54-interacting transcriptional regulator [Planctomycetota bacterium]
MRSQDLGLDQLLELQPGGGRIRFAGQRALLLDAVALGLLRRELIETLGLAAARGLLTRFGYGHGWRTAETVRDAFSWDDPGEWRAAGGRLHTLQGLVIVRPVEGQGGPGRPFAEATWHESFEAEQHLLHLGRAEDPVCWTLTGFATGYLSCCNRSPVYCVETACVGRGDPVCRIVGKPREEWGPELEAHLAFYGDGCLHKALKEVTDELKRAEQRLRSRKRSLARVLGEEDLDPSGMVARSEAMRRVLDLARRAGRAGSTVLITGESGVGKERAARLIHDESPRAGGPFVAINCAAISESLIESELFGHARGAFTGASRERVGLFEAAQGGTLFLDEVGELPPATQVKLLRVLQEREVRRVGENTSRPVDVRLVAATNRDLGREVEAGRFRQDLLFRLKVIELRIPPLRERREDILPLARALLLEVAARLGQKAPGLTAPCADQLLRYAWPGNVRELGNALERALVVCDGERIDLGDLPPEVREAAPAAPPLEPRAAPRTLADVEREHILATLERNDGNRGLTAAHLGIGSATLYRKLKRYEEEAR